jgi:hypothetical protein
MTGRPVASIDAERLRAAARRLLGVAEAQRRHAARMIALADQLDGLIEDRTAEATPEER